MKITFVGHNTFLFELEDGRVFITDPWFKNSRLWRAVPPAFGPEKITRLDFMLSSHNHLDHIDAPSLKMARALGSTVVGSERVVKRAEKAGIFKVAALRSGESFEKDGLKITATPADHPFAPDAIGFLIEWRGRKIYFSGDTRRTRELTEFLKPYSPIDLGFVQTTRTVWLSMPDGMNVVDASELCRSSGVCAAVPMHLHARFKQPNLMTLAKALRGGGIEVIDFGLGESKTFFEGNI